MISSMTGYGLADEQNDILALSVEIHSVNSRFLDFAPRIPKSLQPFEDVAYKMVKQMCERGRVSLSAKIDLIPGTRNGMILNQDKLEEYMTIVRDIQKTSERDDIPSMGDILKLPDIFVKNEPYDEDELKEIFLTALEKALDEMVIIRGGVSHDKLFCVGIGLGINLIHIDYAYTHPLKTSPFGSSHIFSMGILLNKFNKIKGKITS